MSNITSAIPALNKFNQGIELSAKETTVLDTAMKSGSFDRYIEGLNGSSASLSGYVKYMATAEAGTLALSAAQKVAAIATGVLKAALNGIIVLGIVELAQFIGQKIYDAANAVQVQQKAVEELSTAYDDSKKKVQDINTQLSDTQKKIDDLNAKKKLTFVEQDQLDKLKETTKQLQLQKDIAEKEADKKARELGEAAVQSYKTQFGEQSFTQSQVNDYVKNANITGNNAILTSDPSDISAMIAAYKQFSDLKQKAFNSKDNTEVERYNILITDIKDSLNDDVSSLQKVQTAIEKIPVKDRTEEDKKALQDINAAIDLVYNNLDPAKLKTINFNSVVGETQFKSVVDNLKQLAQQGKLTAQTLNGSQYSDFVKAMENVGLSVADIVKQFNALYNASSNANSGITDFSGTITSLTGDINTITSKIDSYAGSMKDLNTAIDTINKGDLLTGEQVAALIQKYPRLTSAIIDTGKGYKFKAGALEEVRKAEIQEQETSINAAIADAQNTINSVLKQINAYSSLIGAIKSVADAKAALADTVSPFNVGGPKEQLDDKTTQEYIQARKLLKSYINVSGQLDTDQKKLNALKESANLVGQNNYEKVDNSGYKSSQKGAGTSVESAAKKAAEALKDQYEAELKVIEANKEMNKYKPDKYGVEGLQYYNALLALQKKWQNSQLDSDDKLELQEKVLSAHKSYEQNILDVSYKELDNRIKLGKTEENSINHLNNLLQIQKLLNSANMSLVNTQENQLELQQKIYDVRKQYAQDIIDKSYKQQQHRESLGIDYNSSLSNDINGDRGILQNLLDIQKLLLNGGTAQPANTEENRWELEEKIYDQKKKILEDDISDLDTQVQLGNIQENSLGYLSKLYSLKQEIIKSDLNAIDKENELNSIEEKILDARKGYIQQLQSDLSDESIVGSYGYRIKQIQDQIDAINNQADAESKELAVEKAKAAWEEAQNQKSISVFRSGKGFVYEADQSAITEKKQAYADAEREEQIEKLTEQKNQIQKDEDAVKTQLDNALSILQGTNNQAWSNILSQIEGVLGRSVSDITSASEQNIDSWDDQNDVLDNTTENTKRNYQQQINVLNKYLTQLTTVQGEISNQNQSIANSFTKMADAIYYVNNEYDRLIRLMSDAETVRETENERYNDYNQGARSNHQTVRYASGTDYASGGLSVVGEDGKETILEPLSSGQYTMLETGSKVFTADMTKNLQKWSQFNPQNMVLKAQLGNSRVRNDITNNKITEQPVVEIHGDLSFPEIHSGDQAQYLINRLCTIGAKARTKVK